jgi:hypothetical protein
MYLLAAVEAFQIGNINRAVTLLNVIRERSAYRAGLSASDLATRVAAMDINASQVTLDFILDVRTRELCCESLRWPDLAMRGKLIERVKLFNPDGAAKIQPFYSLRLIPQSQLNATADNNRAQYQNPGY